MSYDENLARRIRAIFDDNPQIEERPMFGGLAFLLGGKMCCGILQEDLVARLSHERCTEALKQDHVRPMDFTGKPMKGYVYVGPEGYRDSAALKRWVNSTVEFVSTLPRKTRKPRKKAARVARKSKAGARR